MDLVEFLRARIDMDEAEARETADADAEFWSDVKGDGTYFGRFDPVRVLAECEAKRKRIELHAGGHECVEMRTGTFPPDWPATASWGAPCEDWSHPTLEYQDGPCPTLRLEALPYADHPDWREEWRP